MFAHEGKLIVIDQTAELIINTFDNPSPSKLKGKTCILKGKIAREILKGLGIGMPEKPGFPAAMVTGHIKVRSKLGERTFKVYNELLLNDEQDPETYFRLKTPVTSALYSR